MSVGYGQAYQNQRAYDVRPIYATRFIGWAFAIPILLFMCLGSKKDQEGAVAARNQPWSLGGWCSQGSFWFWTIVVCWMFCLQYIGTCVGNNHIFYNPNWLPRHFCVGFLPPATVCCASMIGSCEEVAIVTWFSFLVPGDSLWWFWCLEANRFGYTVSRVLQAQNQSLSLHSK